MAGLKKIVRPLNKIKNEYLQWLKDRNADSIDIYDTKSETDSEWDYYVVVSAFVQDTLYTVYFMMWNGRIDIDYSDGENRYNKMSIEEFKQLLW